MDTTYRNYLSVYSVRGNNDTIWSKTKKTTWL